jgi:hypothetical protein
MTPASWRTLGNVVLVAEVILLVVLVLGMSGVIPRLPGTSELIILAVIMGIFARGARRRGRV